MGFFKGEEGWKWTNVAGVLLCVGAALALIVLVATVKLTPTEAPSSAVQYLDERVTNYNSYSLVLPGEVEPFDVKGCAILEGTSGEKYIIVCPKN